MANATDSVASLPSMSSMSSTMVLLDMVCDLSSLLPGSNYNLCGNVLVAFAGTSWVHQVDNEPGVWVVQVVQDLLNVAHVREPADECAGPPPAAQCPVLHGSGFAAVGCLAFQLDGASPDHGVHVGFSGVAELSPVDLPGVGVLQGPNVPDAFG